MGRKPVRINTNEELDRRSRKILSRSEKAARQHLPGWTKCRHCKGGDAYLDDEYSDAVYHCMHCGQEWDA